MNRNVDGAANWDFGAINWNDGNDRVGVTLFTTDDNTSNGVPSYIETLFSATSTAFA